MSDTKTRLRQIITRLRKEYPDADCLLQFETPLELLVASILAAQCTDERVNQTTPALFRKYRTAASYAEAPQQDIIDAVASISFCVKKARAIQAVCRALIDRHGGELPADVDQLSALPGVGRKTANVVLGNAMGVPSIIVDTHVLRLSGRLGLASQRNVDKKYADKVEAELLEIVPSKDRTLFSHLLACHGRTVCTARKPLCPRCVIEPLCPYPDKTPAELLDK